ncbi:Cubilin [Lamellibrachia satsuma]|nr:Cubilin [Lamellibrachia satsuma]
MRLFLTANTSPPQAGNHSSANTSPPQTGIHSSANTSPPQRGNHSTANTSPPQTGNHSSANTSPPQTGNHSSANTSPPHTGNHSSAKTSPPQTGNHSSANTSPPQTINHSSANTSPPQTVTIHPPIPRLHRQVTIHPLIPRLHRQLPFIRQYLASTDSYHSSASTSPPQTVTIHPPIPRLYRQLPFIRQYLASTDSYHSSSNTSPPQTVAIHPPIPRLHRQLPFIRQYLASTDSYHSSANTSPPQTVTIHPPIPRLLRQLPFIRQYLASIDSYHSAVKTTPQQTFTIRPPIPSFHRQPAGTKPLDPSSPPDLSAPSSTQRRKWLCGSRGLALVFVLPAIVIASLVGVIIYSDIAAKISPQQTGNHSATKTSPPQTETFYATMKLDKLHYDPNTYGNPDSSVYQKLAGDFCSRPDNSIIETVDSCGCAGIPCNDLVDIRCITVYEVYSQLQGEKLPCSRSTQKRSDGSVTVHFKIVVLYHNNPRDKEGRQETLRKQMMDDIRMEAEKKNSIFRQYLNPEAVAIVVIPSTKTITSTTTTTTTATAPTKLPTANKKSPHTNYNLKPTSTASETATSPAGLTMPHTSTKITTTKPTTGAKTATTAAVTNPAKTTYVNTMTLTQPTTTTPQVRVSDVCGQPSVQPEFPLIVGGTEAKEHSWPWQISLVLQGFGHICRGSILNKRWIVTAAHCVKGRKLSQLRAIVGQHNRSLSKGIESTLAIDRIVRYPLYSKGTFRNNDIALVRLKCSLVYSREVAPVCLPVTEISPGTMCVATGWGRTRGTGDDKVLRQVRVPIIATQTCNGAGWWKNQITDAMICAGYKDGTRNACACSGSPAVLNGAEGTFGINKAQYKNNMKCGWKIHVDESKVVKLEFLTFKVEYSVICRYDNVTVYDGVDSSATLQGTFCGGLPRVNISSTNSMFVTFKSDPSVTKNGFKIRYTSVARPKQIACHGSAAILNGREGMFGIDRQQYRNNTKCSWKIQVHPSKVVKLEFLTFDVEEDAEEVELEVDELEDLTTCVYDKLTIYNGENDTAPELGTFCGATLPRDYISSNRYLFVSFKSDASVTKGGFKIKYTAIVDRCHRSAETLTGPEGFIEINQAEYRNRMQCGWRIQFDPPKIVKLEFLLLNVQQSFTCRGDSVTVYDGANNSAPLLGRFCGHTPPGVVVSSTNSLFVSFQTDYILTKDGFIMKYTAIYLPPACNGTSAEMNGRYGYLGVVGSHYRNDIYCQWQITVEAGKRVLLHFDRFDVQDDKNCARDNVTFTDSVTGDALYTFCGNNTPGDVISLSNQLLVIFKTDSSNTSSGFLIKYTTWTTNHVSDACGQPSVPPQFPLIVDGTEAKGYSWPWQISLFLQGYGHICGGSILNKRWILTAAHCVEDEKTSQLRVVVGEHNRYKFEGTEMVLEVERFFIYPRYFTRGFNNDIALIRLKGSLEYRREVAPVCLPDTDISPGTVCVTTGWGHTAGTGDNKVLRQVIAPIIATETCNGTGWWSKRITDEMGDSGGPLVCRSVNGQWTLHGITSWSSRNCKLRSLPSVYVRVRKFASWINQTINGRTACSGETPVFTEQQGEFGSEGHPYYNNENCRWSIEVEKGALLQLHFERFELETQTGGACHYDKVNIYDGSNATAELMHSLCGSNLPDDVITTGNTVFVTFTSDDTRAYTGFRISYRTMFPVKGCRGSATTLTGPEGMFGIDQKQYENNMKCGWKIQVELSKRVQVEFLTLSVENHSNCNYDNVKVYDGVDASAPLKGTFCGTTLPRDDINSTTNSMFMAFQSDSSVTKGGFKIKYTAIVPSGLTFDELTLTTKESSSCQGTKIGRDIDDIRA